MASKAVLGGPAGGIGARSWPIDWEARSRGAVPYVADMLPDDVLHGAILRSPHPHAEILSIDTGAARAMPGVRAVITAADFPQDARYACYGTFDRPPLADGVVRFIGQEVAAVAADTLDQARAAAAVIAVRYRRLKAPLSMAQARDEGAPDIHAPPPPPTGDAPAPPPQPRNVRRGFRLRWGDPDGARASASHSVSGRFWHQQQNQCCMETHRTLADWREGRLHLWSSTATPLIQKGLIATLLGIEPNDVVVHEVAVGGSFGAKLQVNGHEALAVVLAREAKRPVVVTLNREEEFETNYTRHGFDLDMALHADENGRLRSFSGAVNVDNGAYLQCGNAVMGASLMAFGEMYDADGVDIEAKLVDTCKVPGGAMRGYGGPQTTFAREVLVDDMASKLGRDPIDLRIQNAYGSHQETLAGHVGTNGTVDCLKLVREAIDWDTEKGNRTPGRGVGVATGEHLSGAHTFPNSNRADSMLDLSRDGSLRVRCGSSDVGTGQNTMVAQIAAQELGVPWEKVSVLSMDTDLTPMEWGGWGSRGTHYSAHAVGLAARCFADRLKRLAAERLGEGEIRLEDGFARSEAGEVPLGDLVAMSNEAQDGVLSHSESFIDENVQLYNPREKTRITATHNFAAHAAVVQVDERTGKVAILDYVAASDAGTILNPLLLEGQVSGAVVTGMGGALAEEMIFEQGKLVNPAFLSYAVPRAADVPGVRVLHAPQPDELGPYGAKGVGELGVNPVLPAVANAVFDAVGVRLHNAPLTPDKVLGALREKHGAKRDFKIWRRPGRWYIELVRRIYPFGLFQILHWWQSRQNRPVKPVAPIAAIEKPASIAAAVAALGHDAALLGGGTELHLRRRDDTFSPPRLVSVGGVAELRQLVVGASGDIVIGAGVTLDALAQAVRGRIPALSDAIEEIASPQIRNVATVAGNLVQAKRCWFYRNGFNCYKRRGHDAPCYAVLGDHRFYHAAIDGHRCQAVTPSDLGNVLTALDAVVTIAGPKGERDVAITAFYTGPGETCLGERDVVVRITIPAQAADRRTAVRKLNLWQGDFAIASATLSVALDEAGRCTDARLVLGAVAPVPWRARRTEQRLIGQQLSTATLRALLDEELDAHGHPLARNGWKLDAAAGLSEHVTDDIIGDARVAEPA